MALEAVLIFQQFQIWYAGGGVPWELFVSKRSDEELELMFAEDVMRIDSQFV